MLLDEGEPYQQILVDETARNMRANMPLQVSIVIIVPVKGTTPDKVGLLVITKDIWSLRLSFDVAVTPGGVENLLIVPQETNLFGWHHTASTRFQYQPETYTFGVGYKIPRFGTSWIGAVDGREHHDQSPLRRGRGLGGLARGRAGALLDAHRVGVGRGRLATPSGSRAATSTRRSRRSTRARRRTSSTTFPPSSRASRTARPSA